MSNVLAVAGPGSRFQVPGATPAGFWAGLWHGLESQRADIRDEQPRSLVRFRVHHRRVGGVWWWRHESSLSLGVRLADASILRTSSERRSKNLKCRNADSHSAESAFY
jgi:hypothetical protein